MKRFLIAALCLLLIAASICGCNKKKADEEAIFPLPQPVFFLSFIYKRIKDVFFELFARFVAASAVKT